MRAFLNLCFSPSIVRRALLTALIVGAILIAINHGDAILRGEMNPDRWWKAALTVVVPYLVSTVSSASTLMSLQRGGKKTQRRTFGRVGETMDAKKVILVLVDISGYTHFIRTQKMSALHAEEIIFELLEAVIDKAEYPLTLNKLEGDAVFLYAEVNEKEMAQAARKIARQVQGFFNVFYARAKTLTEERAECGCNACSRVHDLRLKVLLHVGEAIFRQIRQFEELAGEDVIAIHRLLKNNVPTREYILMTESFYKRAGNLSGMVHTESAESYEDLGTLNVHVFQPQPKEAQDKPLPTLYF